MYKLVFQFVKMRSVLECKESKGAPTAESKVAPLAEHSTRETKPMPGSGDALTTSPPCALGSSNTLATRESKAMSMTEHSQPSGINGSRCSGFAGPGAMHSPQDSPLSGVVHSP